MKASTVIFCILLFSISSQSFSQTGVINDTPSDKKIYFNAGIAGPIFDLQEVYQTGFSAEAGVILFSPPVTPFSITLSAGFNSFKYRPEFFTNSVRSSLGIEVSNFTPDWKVTDIPVMAGIKLKFDRANVIPYIAVEAGVHFLSFNERFNGNEVMLSNTQPSSISLNGVSETASETSFGARIGIGTEVAISTKLNLDFGVKYNYVGATFTKLYKVSASNNSQFISQQRDRFEYITAQLGLIINL